MRMIAHRIADPRILRLIRLWLRAGVMEDGVYADTVEGTPQGAGISPLLANIYLHYALDLWVAQWRRREARRHVRLVRYADDYLLLFEERADALRMLAALPDRLAKFGLSLHEGKTRLVEFGRFAAANRHRRGEGRPETFDFLGFTHFCGVTRKGGFMVQRKTQRTRMTRKLKELRAAMKKRRHDPVADQSRWLGAVLRGHYAYFGITGNSASITKFHFAVVQWGAGCCDGGGSAPRSPGRGSTPSWSALHCRDHGSCPTGATRCGRSGNPVEEPGARKSHAGICEGGDGRPSPLLDQLRPDFGVIWRVSR
jgi:RNA-directed DNA polymerase